MHEQLLTYYVYVIKPVEIDKCYIGAAVNFLRELERYISQDADYFPAYVPERIVRCFTLPNSKQKEARQFRQFLISAQEYGVLEPVLDSFVESSNDEYISIVDFIRTLKRKTPAYTYANIQKSYIVVLNGKKRILRANGTLLK